MNKQTLVDLVFLVAERSRGRREREEWGKRGDGISRITSETICSLIKTSAAQRREKLTFRNEIEAAALTKREGGGKGESGGKKVSSEFNLK